MTSKIQPCDAGIIRAFKMHYRRRFYKNLLEGHELELPNPEKINVLDAIKICSLRLDNQCFSSVNSRQCKIRSNVEISSDSSETNFEESLHEFENMIKDVGYRNEIDVNKLVDCSGENNECSVVQSLEEIIVDIIEDPANDEVEDDSIPLEPVTRKEALSATTTLHNFLLQLENSTSEHLAAIKKVRGEIQLDLNF
ncbi:UNVERIFIED_CONTAM: hypothetical protein Sradi_6665900 [Sesamum radiatum]|uniref:DDE-1 domain-containing protein n=1 Tax=Sesamum radiatum TaxID=300843 RepID=A0AAW2JRA5_SESRA